MTRVTRDVIEIRGLEVRCVVGIYPHERAAPQRLIVDAAMESSTEGAAGSERLDETLDYTAIAAQIAFLLEGCRFGLLETAAHALAKALLAAPAPGERRGAMDALRLTLSKPDALGPSGVPSITIARDAAWARATALCEPKPWGNVDTLHETRDAGIYRLNVAPGARIPRHVHRVMREVEMMLGDGLLCQGRRAPAGSVHRWAHDVPHRYDNPTEDWQTILCVDAPPFLPDDEIEVGDLAADPEGAPTEAG